MLWPQGVFAPSVVVDVEIDEDPNRAGMDIGRPSILLMN